MEVSQSSFSVDHRQNKRFVVLKMQKIDRNGRQIYLYNNVISQKRFRNPSLMVLLREDGEKQRLFGNFK